jgi:hypothetical protein
MKVAFLLLIFGAAQLFGQGEYIGRFDLYSGFTYLDSPHIHLSERGYHLQAGVRARTWLSLGFDYSVSTGNTTILPSYLTTTLQNQLAAQIGQLVQAGIVPPTYSPIIPIDSNTQTFAAGPQLDWHRWRHLTLFVRPSIGAIRERATLHPGDPIVTAIASQLAPGGEKLDWVGFYGFGGGGTVRVTDHFGLRLQADFVHDHLFSDLLRDGRNTVRLSIGPAIQFGGNVAK